MKDDKKVVGVSMLHKSFSLIWLISVVILLGSTSAHAIKKCKDANGKWHYGDVAACEDSKVTTLSGKGYIKEQKTAPKTKEQLAAEQGEREELEKERLRKEEIEKERSRILTVYETEADIDRQLENQLYSVDSNIAVHNTYLDSMKEVIAYEKKKLATTTHPAVKSGIEDKITTAEKDVQVYTKEIDSLKAQREEVIKRFGEEKLTYRELTKSAEDKK